MSASTGLRVAFGVRFVAGRAVPPAHIALDLSTVLFDVVYNTLVQCPHEKVKLAHGRLDVGVILEWYVYSFPSAERVESLLFVGPQTEAVFFPHREPYPLEDVASKMLLCVVCDEPIYQPEGQLRCPVDDWKDSAEVLVVVGAVELC